MKKVLTNFKSDPADKKRWLRAVKLGDKTLTDVCIAALNRYADRVEKKNGLDK